MSRAMNDAAREEVFARLAQSRAEMAAALTEGMLTMMFMSKVKVVAAVLVTSNVVAAPTQMPFR